MFCEKTRARQDVKWRLDQSGIYVEKQKECRNYGAKKKEAMILYAKKSHTKREIMQFLPKNEIIGSKGFINTQKNVIFAFFFGRLKVKSNAF